VLFDRLSALASRDASANIWDDSEVQARLLELGVQLPASTDADPDAPSQEQDSTDSESGEMAETQDDPMNYNAAITGAYYESKQGDALLARIKSLALLK
jgi:hypothetical protein